VTRYSLVNGTVQVLKWTLAPAGLYPAIKINLEAVAGQGSGWVAAAVCSVIFCAVCFELAHRAKSWGQAGVLLLVGGLFLLNNCQTAIENSAGHTGGVRDGRAHQAESVADAKQQVKVLEARRGTQVKIAGETPVVAVESEIQARIAKDANRWRNSSECSPSLISAGATKEFCEEVAILKAKKAAAELRDKLDGQIEAERQRANSEAPSVADPGIEQMIRLMGLFGVQDTPKARENAVFFRDCRKGVVLEVLGAVSIFLVSLVFSFIPKWRSSGPTELSHEELAGAAAPGEPDELETYRVLFGMVVRKLDSEKRPLEVQSVPALAKLLRVDARRFRKWFDRWIGDDCIKCEYRNPETKRGGFAVKLGSNVPARLARKRA
jgi:hypothetical protein